MSIKPYAKPYNIMQYIKQNEYITISELSEKTNIGVPTIKKQLSKLKNSLSNTGYKISSCNKGIKLIRGDSDYLPVDLIFFNSQEYDFITIYIDFIISGLSDYTIFNKMYSAKFYTDRQVKYFFKSNLNMRFSEFKEKSNFEHFSLFVEYCVLWCSCKNIKQLFNEYLQVSEFNNYLFTYPNYKDISANDYMTIYSCLVFEKISNVDISNEYSILQKYFKEYKFSKGLQYYKQIVCFTQISISNNIIYDRYCKLSGIKKLNYNVDVIYKNMDAIEFELEWLQYQSTTKIVNREHFNLCIVFEGSLYHLAMIRGSLKKNYPNININFVPSWIYLYGTMELDGYILSNAIIDENVQVIMPRDEQNNYNLNFDEITFCSSLR